MSIQIGIDLGTTNSEIAILNGSSVQIVKNTYGDEFTPSVFGINKSNEEQVGKKAYEKLFRDALQIEVANHKAEIKRLMGKKDEIYFSRIDKSYDGEEILNKILIAFVFLVFLFWRDFATLFY